MKPSEDESSLELAPPKLREAMEAKGFTSLTQVQSAVVDPTVAGRDLRISSQTGSGKTIALGIALCAELEATREEGIIGPRALVIAPTRELAAQVQKELSWLYEPSGYHVVAVTGGTSFGGELRSLRRGADVVVGTPGRMLDHLEKGTIDPRAITAVVLDEADQMLDLGFRDELEGILKKVPDNRRTHLCSATFSRDIIDLSRRYQKDALAVQGTRLGEANVDIAHIIHVIAPSQRDDVLVNLLLLAPDEATLVFVRTRVDGADLASQLSQLGFAAASLTGDMEQRDRTRTLEAFRNGNVKVLVATDVAARGIDTDVSRVIHADPPSDPDVYTHRSGRTGRAGRKGQSILIVPPQGRELATRIMRRARVEATWAKVPSEDEVLEAVDARLVASLLAAETKPDARSIKLAGQLLETLDPQDLIARLLARPGSSGICAPRKIAVLDPTPRPSSPTSRYGAREGRFARDDRPTRHDGPRNDGPRNDGPRNDGPRNDGPRNDGPPMMRRERKAANDYGFVPFRINWGDFKGADPRRLLAMVCRRGNVRGADVGAIQIGTTESIFEIASARADEFARAVSRPDPRDPGVRIEPLVGATFERPRRTFGPDRDGGAPPRGGDRPATRR